MKGTRYPSESREFEDPGSGRKIRQVTGHKSIHHHPFYYLPAYDDAMEWLVLVSHRTGRPEIFIDLGNSDGLQQLTDHPGISEYSIHPSHDGQFIYFTDRSGAWRVSSNNLKEDCLVDFSKILETDLRSSFSTKSTTSLSRDDRWWAVPVKSGSRSRFYIINTSNGHHEMILERDSIGHPEFHPDDPGLLRYAGPYHNRMWVINRDGSNNRLVYKRKVKEKEWIVHETWLPGTRELVTTNWGKGMTAVDVDSGQVRRVTDFPAWHAAVNRTGTSLVADTTFPDTGLHTIDPRPGKGQSEFLCQSTSSNLGDHWNTGHCPYDDGVTRTDALQHTHPHPSFSPDGKRVVFTSDRSGYAQVYECYLD